MPRLFSFMSIACQEMKTRAGCRLTEQTFRLGLSLALICFSACFSPSAATGIRCSTGLLMHKNIHKICNYHEDWRWNYALCKHPSRGRHSAFGLIPEVSLSFFAWLCAHSPTTERTANWRIIFKIITMAFFSLSPTMDSVWKKLQKQNYVFSLSIWKWPKIK